MELAEICWRVGTERSREEVGYTIDDVTVSFLVRLNEAIERLYFHRGLLGVFQECICNRENDVTTYSRGGKSYVRIIELGNHRIQIQHYYPDSAFDRWIRDNVPKAENFRTVHE